MSLEKAPHARGSVAAWTGSEMLVWGAAGEDDWTGEGAAYDPAADTWRPLPAGPTRGDAAVWTGRVWLLWGLLDCATGQPAAHHAYDPTADAWRTMSLEGAPSGRELVSMAWTRDRAFLFGGFSVELCDEHEVIYGAADDGALYDPEADTWTPVATPSVPAPARAMVAMAGDEVLLWDASESTGAIYSVGTDSWSTISPTGAPGSTTSSAAAWTGEELLVFGGPIVGGGGRTTDDGGLYDPSTDTWRPLPAQELPSPRRNHSMVVRPE